MGEPFGTTGGEAYEDHAEQGPESDQSGARRAKEDLHTAGGAASPAGPFFPAGESGDVWREGGYGYLC